MVPAANSLHSVACDGSGQLGRDAPLGLRSMTELAVRSALRDHLLAAASAGTEAVDELWVPRSNERADVAIINSHLAGFEIKTERDTLQRLPRQAEAYGRIFDRCTAVVAARHARAAVEAIPAWWGIVEVSANGHVTFTERRKARANPAIDPDILVRLLWREEVATALAGLHVDAPPRASRSALWTALLDATDLAKLRAIVRRALLARRTTPSKRRSPFTQATDAAGSGR